MMTKNHKAETCRLIRYVEGMARLMGAPISLKDYKGVPSKQEIKKFKLKFK